jgi:hypothetical protein
MEDDGESQIHAATSIPRNKSLIFSALLTKPFRVSGKLFHNETGFRFKLKQTHQDQIINGQGKRAPAGCA